MMFSATNQNSTNSAEEGGTLSEPLTVPTPLRWLVPAVGVGVFLLIALPVVMLIGREGFLRDSILENSPGLRPDFVDFAINASLVYTVVLHAIDVVLSIWFVVKVLQGRQWARIALTAYLLIATFGSLYSAAMGAAYLWAVIPGDGVHIVMLVLLWLPPSVREFFRAHRAARARGSAA